MKWLLVCPFWLVAGSGLLTSFSAQKVKETEFTKSLKYSAGGSWIEFTGKELKNCPPNFLPIIRQIPMEYELSNQKLVRPAIDKRSGSKLCSARLKTVDIVVVEHDTGSGRWLPLISIYEQSDNKLVHKFFWSRRFSSFDYLRSGSILGQNLTLVGEQWLSKSKRTSTKVVLALPNRYKE